MLGSSTVHAAHYLGFLLIPVAVFLVGVCEYDLLHAGYLAQLLVYFLSSTAKLEPPLETAVVPLRKVLSLTSRPIIPSGEFSLRTNLWVAEQVFCVLPGS